MRVSVAGEIDDRPTTAPPRPLFRLRPVRATGAFSLNSGKRLFDCLIALPLLLVSLPVMLLAALWIGLVSPGFPLHRQKRLGLGGRPFTLLKLRTMRTDCERPTGPRWADPDDPRVIPGGQLLRRWHCDELPQLWNVLRGEMSLVGPRPERPEIFRKLQKEMPDVARRLGAVPGLTGLAQVTLPPDSDPVGFRRKTDLDLRYIREGTLEFDLRILYWTALKLAGLRAAWVYPRVGRG